MSDLTLPQMHISKPDQKKKKQNLNASEREKKPPMWWAGKNKIVSSPVSGKEEKQRIHATVWAKRMRTRWNSGMGLLFTADEAGGFSALSLIYLAFPSPGAEQHLIVLPVPGPFMCCQLLSLTSDKTKPSNSLHKKATEGLLPQSLRPGKGKK